MADILHRIVVDAPPADVFRLLVADALVSEALVASLSPAVSMRLVQIDDAERVMWRCERGPDAWRGTEVTIDLARDGRATVMRLSHAKWREASDAMADCATRWARALFALKARAETPEPEDVQI